ncbi:MAG: diguanylate cyclase domain-containing protein [Pseudomonadota bacterium]
MNLQERLEQTVVSGNIMDLLLRQVAGRLVACVRQTDTVGRPGGDEFTILLRHIPDAGSVQSVIDKIHRAMEDGFPVGGREVSVALSIGRALYPDDGEDSATLYQVADQAMYASRTAGH